MSMKYSKSVSFSACLIALTGLLGCQSAQQKVYQQASLSTPEYHPAPYTQTEPVSPKYQNHNQLFSEPASEPVGNDFPPAAPPSLAPPQTKKQVDKKRSLILKTSQEDFANDQEYFKSEFSSDLNEPAQKYLGLVPRYSSVSSSVSQKVKQMNGKVKDFCTNMKSHLKAPGWIRKISGSHHENDSAVDNIAGDISCVETNPFTENIPAQSAPLSPQLERFKSFFPQPLHSNPQSKPIPIQPHPLLEEKVQPKLKKKGLPRLPVPKKTTMFQENSWNVSATVEQLPVKNYSTFEDQIELWPYSKQRMLQETQVNQFRKIKRATPVSTPHQFKTREKLTHPRELSVPSMLSQEPVNSIRKIRFQKSEPDVRTVETLEYSPIVITPRR